MKKIILITLVFGFNFNAHASLLPNLRNHISGFFGINTQRHIPHDFDSNTIKTREWTKKNNMNIECGNNQSSTLCGVEYYRESYSRTEEFNDQGYHKSTSEEHNTSYIKTNFPLPKRRFFKLLWKTRF